MHRLLVPDKVVIEMEFRIITIFAQKYHMVTRWNCITKEIPLSTQKVYFGAKITKTNPSEYAESTLLIFDSKGRNQTAQFDQSLH